MKEELRTHIINILNSIGMIDSLVRVYDCQYENIPQFITAVNLNSFLCIIEINASCQNFKKLEKLINKEIIRVSFEEKKFLYWFEENIFETFKKYDVDFFSNQEKFTFKTHTRLPNWLDSYIYNTLIATYNPDYVKYSSNLNRTKEEVLVYLGTYFPRSYAESFCILNNLLQNNTIFSEYSHKEEIKILSIGCGTGGDLVGLLVALSKKLPLLKTVTIKAIDGNDESICILDNILTKCSNYVNFKINFDIYNRKFTQERGFIFFDDAMIKFDFILSFKMLSELISKYDDSLQDVYYIFCKDIMRYLSDCGICVLLDITNRKNMEDINSKFIPELLNFQINRALKELVYYKTLLPLSCNLYESKCNNNNCFTQKKFTVSHKMRSNDLSKVTYRIIIPKQFSDKIFIHEAHPEKKYIIGAINKSYSDHKDINLKICQYSYKHINEADAFDISGVV